MLFVIACIYHFLESKIDVENLTTSYFTRLIKAWEIFAMMLGRTWDNLGNS